MPLNKIEEFCDKNLEAGRHLASVSCVHFPDAERVREAIEKCSVKDFKQYMTTKEICKVSVCAFS